MMQRCGLDYIGYHKRLYAKRQSPILYSVIYRRIYTTGRGVGKAAYSQMGGLANIAA